MKLPGILLIVAAFTAFGQAPELKARPALSGEDARTLSSYKLSMDNVMKAAAASGSLNRLFAGDPALKNGYDKDSKGPATFDMQIRRLEKSPPSIVSAIRIAGLSPRDYFLTITSLLVSVRAAGMKERGRLQALPAGASAANLAFVETHKPEIRALMRAIAPPRPRRLQ